jgi:D-aminoacyl-tRNA deacylase
MMRVLLCSLADNASVNIRDRLLEIGDWEEQGQFEGNPVYRCEETMMVSIQQLHIHAEEVDGRMEQDLGIAPEVVIFLSRHRAASGIPTLTVHPIGNHRAADFGGRESTLVPAVPHLMTSLLRTLAREAIDLDFEVSFEVTHHGPFLSTPSIFIEIGSDETMWDHREAAEAIARTLVGTKMEENPIAIGMGGGHYAPRFTEVVMRRRVSMGHMIPSYAMKGADDQALREMVENAVEASGSDMVYVHKKSMKRSEATSLKKMLTGMGLKVIESKDLDPL